MTDSDQRRLGHTGRIRRLTPCPHRTREHLVPVAGQAQCLPGLHPHQRCRQRQAVDERPRLDLLHLPWPDCLSSLYDKAFDQGLISFSDHYHVLFSYRLKENVGKEYFTQYFEPIANCSLNTTGLKYPVAPEFLEWHRDCVFERY